MYKPPFTISSKTINLIADISAQIERYAVSMEQTDRLKLRKSNRIKTIRASLAIEGNTLSENQVTDILDGKTVVAPLRDIQEVKNAIKTYELYHTLDPFDYHDMLRAHSVMMHALIDDAGHFRKSDVGVFSSRGCEHFAPPASRVPTLIADLFKWLRQSTDHLLIRSCVFHYEFEYIHPFIDGNGRMGRLWQSLILGRLHPLFEHLPVENMVFSNQRGYYAAIQKSTDAGDCAPFIEFMLTEILKTLRQHHKSNQPDFQRKSNRKSNQKSDQKILSLIKKNSGITIREIAKKINLSESGVKKNLQILKQKGKIRRIGPDKGGHWEVL